MNLLLKSKDENLSMVEKRSSERVPTTINAQFFYGNLFYSGTVLNVSEKGMFINTRRCLPKEAMFVVMVRSGKRSFKVIAKVKRANRFNDDCNGMGVELLSPSSEYLRFIDNLKISCH